MADVAIGERGIAVLYFAKNSEWLQQGFSEEKNTLAGFSQIVAQSSAIRISMLPEHGVKIEFLSDKIKGNLPTAVFKRIAHPMTDEEFERRVAEYGVPEHVNQKAIDAFNAIDTSSESKMADGILKWVLTLMEEDDDAPWDFQRVKGWEFLKQSALSFSQKHPEFGELEVDDPLNGKGFGLAEFHLFSDRKRVIHLTDDYLAGFKDMVNKSQGIILETMQEDGDVFINLCFDV